MTCCAQCGCAPCRCGEPEPTTLNFENAPVPEGEGGPEDLSYRFFEPLAHAFIMPAVAGSTTIDDLEDTSRYTVGMEIFLPGIGHLEISGIPSGTSLQVTNPGYPSNVAAGVGVPAGTSLMHAPPDREMEVPLGVGAEVAVGNIVPASPNTFVVTVGTGESDDFVNWIGGYLYFRGIGWLKLTAVNTGADQLTLQNEGLNINPSAATVIGSGVQILKQDPIHPGPYNTIILTLASRTMELNRQFVRVVPSVQGPDLGVWNGTMGWQWGYENFNNVVIAASSWYGSISNAQLDPVTFPQAYLAGSTPYVTTNIREDYGVWGFVIRPIGTGYTGVWASNVGFWPLLYNPTESPWLMTGGYVWHALGPMDPVVLPNP